MSFHLELIIDNCVTAPPAGGSQSIAKCDNNTSDITSRDLFQIFQIWITFPKYLRRSPRQPGCISHIPPPPVFRILLSSS